MDGYLGIGHGYGYGYGHRHGWHGTAHIIISKALHRGLPICLI